MNHALLIGFAAAYLWYLLAEATITDKPMGYLRERFPLLIGCPWCSGFWLTGLLLLATGTYDPVTHLAAATVVGVVGRWAV